MSSFKDKVVVVTGACGGIGSETARLFAKRQANLVLVDLSEEDLKRTAKMCQKEGTIDVLTIRADLTVKDDLESVVRKTIDRFKKVDVLVSNAGICRQLKISQTSWEDYDTTMNINLKAPYFLIKGFVPELIKTKGCIVNTSSLAGKVSAPDYAAYCVSKAGLNHLTQIVARENARFGVKVNSVCPASTDTKMIGTKENPSILRLLAKQTQPLGGLILPEKIAFWIVLLSSKDCGPITGQNVVVDGGFEVNRIPLDYKMPSSL